MPGVQWFPWRTSTAAASTASAVSSDLPTITARVNTSPFADGIKVLCAIRDLSTPADAFQWDGSWFGHPGTELIDFYAGTPTLREMVDQGLEADAIVQAYQTDVAAFKQHRKQFLLY